MINDKLDKINEALLCNAFLEAINKSYKKIFSKKMKFIDLFETLYNKYGKASSLILHENKYSFEY